MENLFKEIVKGESLGVFIGRIVCGVIAVIGLAVLFGYVIMWLWNTLMPDIFGLPVISYWQAVGLFILSKILLCSGGSGGKHKSDCSSKKQEKHKFKSFATNRCAKSFSDWQYYEKFWEEEGSEAYEKFIKRMDENSNIDAKQE